MLRRTKDRTIAKARDIAIYLSRDLSGVSCRELGEVFGGISVTAITMRYKQITKDVAGDRSLRGLVNGIRKSILNI